MEKKNLTKSIDLRQIEETFLVTHVSVHQESGKKWKEIGYWTKSNARTNKGYQTMVKGKIKPISSLERGTSIYRHGKDGNYFFLEHRINTWMRIGLVKKMEKPFYLKSNQSLYLDPEGDIYVADSNMGEKDPERNLLFRIN